jgi:hypothetical protein
MTLTPFRLLSLVLFVPCWLVMAVAQASYTSQIRGTISDQTGAVIHDATVAITNDATAIALTTKTDATGAYILTGLRPATYTLRVEAAGFRTAERTNVVLAVDQQTTLNIVLQPASASTTVMVTEAAPLLDTESASLGTDVTNEYVRDIPLFNRSFYGLVYLSGGVTETTGSGITDNYPSGTNFISNGQRNATAEVRLDGTLTSAPEQGEGATNNVSYQPSVEIVQEFKVQNNSFSSEFGNNGGTILNVVLKQGGNKFHGSGWWYGQRSALDARDFFNTDQKPDHVRDQYGFSISGPIHKGKTFFFFDFEKTRQNDPINIAALVPTALERQGNFSQSGTDIFNPFDCVPNQPPDPPGCTRTPFDGNIIPDVPGGPIDTIGRNLINLYPQENHPGEDKNFRTVLLGNSPAYQFDIKVDHNFTNEQRLSGRYSRGHSGGTSPTLFANDEFGDGIASATSDVHNVGLEHNWTITPLLLWTNHLGVDRATQASATKLPDPTSAGFTSILTRDNGISRMPAILMDDPYTPLFSQCCVDTKFAHSLYSYSSALSWVKGRHIFKFGGEQRLFYNNFYQPDYPSGFFHFSQTITSKTPLQSDGGNPFASLLLGYGDFGGLSIKSAVSNKSKETAFYVQDNWKVTSRLTLNLGLRYEWSTPYDERKNHIQFSDFNGSSGITVDLTPPTVDADGNALPDLGGFGYGPTNLRGITRFPTSGNRSVPVDRNNWAPRLGFAYDLGRDTVVRGGAGIYYGLSVATNFQYPGTAFRKDGVVHFSINDAEEQRFATLDNPFPDGLPGPQGNKYGALALWGFANGNDLGTESARNAEIYQWNLGIQHLFPAQIVIGADYSASRSTHLPWGGYSSTRNRNFIPSAVRRLLTSENLSDSVANPFQSLFVGPNAIFNEPDSLYNNDTISLISVLRPFPQFDGNFEGLPALNASSAYHSFQLRFQKRPTHGISFEGNYTLSKLTDDSSTGANAFVGTLNNGNPQELDNLKAEHGISANDTTHRLVAAVIVDVPVGRSRWLGSSMNRFLDGVIGGWSLYSVFTAQSGQPLSVALVNPLIADGNQRPNVVCSNPKTGLSAHDAAIQNAAFLDPSCFDNPDDQQPGNAPRYFSKLRADGVHSMDFSLSKEFVPKEGMKIQVRAEFFNFTNTPRFAPPDTASDKLPGHDQANGDFGKITSTAPGSTPRHMQIGVRFEF